MSYPSKLQRYGQFAPPFQKVVNDELIEGIERSAVSHYGTPTLISSSPVIGVACDEFLKLISENKIMTTLTFQNTTLSVIKQQNQIWLSTAEISKALGYNRSDNVLKLYNAHQDEFTPNPTALSDEPVQDFVISIRLNQVTQSYAVNIARELKARFGDNVSLNKAK
ncbi:hypothetical protein [Rodentibacter caecimuris]|uniref:hypothetical protein n=1 Tax=Rodentibacter caecimuris TaxID=1796644 RepID=UPI0013A07E76|nr:hypothetical protein [Rodentibacter heylii]QIA76132.1 hypothetical protein FEE42_01540 [Rodentibacter heylii]